MTPERLAEIKGFLGDMNRQRALMLSAFPARQALEVGIIMDNQSELIDALTAERARAEKAEAKFTEADRRLDIAIKWIADSRWDSRSAGKLLNQIDIPYTKEKGIPI